jgi:Raf kinase inhibitor-like YbhB/YbcL family protein
MLAACGQGPGVTDSCVGGKEVRTVAARKPFEVRSAAMAEGAAMPEEYTGDGAGVSPPLEWTGAPAGTKSYVLIMHHTDVEGVTFSYWILYNIPAEVQGLPRDAKNIGTPGLSSRGNHLGYTPPHSAGPGTKTYVFTVYALSAPLRFTGQPTDVTMASLRAAMKGITLAIADLKVTHTRYPAN